MLPALYYQIADRSKNALWVFSTALITNNFSAQLPPRRKAESQLISRDYALFSSWFYTVGTRMAFSELISLKLIERRSFPLS